jgi:hypothetical protein
LQNLKSQHLQKVQAERNFILSLAMKTQYEPDSEVFLATDKMSPLKMPHIALFPKSLLTKSRPKYNVFGLVDATQGTCHYATFFDWWSQDANAHLTFLYMHIRKLRLSGKRHINLYLNTDNAAKDNKNKFMFGFFLYYLNADGSIESNFIC